jgi:Suppressor of fused protein (SUFU)
MFSLFGFGGKGQSIKFDNPAIQKNISTQLGKPLDVVYHAVVPFEMGYDAGGRADVYTYNEKIKGVTYITGDLIGTKQKKSDAGNYELMVCHKLDNEWGRELISNLSYYTLDASLNSGETMSLGSFAKGDIVAVVFDKFFEFTISGKKYGLMLIMGITEKELEWKEEHGGKELIKKFKENKVYPYTDFERKSVVNN